MFSVYIPDCVCVENNPVNVLSSVSVVKRILSGADNLFENESNLQSFKGSHSLLSVFCCNFSWKKVSKSPGISWNFDFEFVWQPCKYQKQSIKNKIKIINTKTKVDVGAYLSKKIKNGLYNTYHELPSEKWIVKTSRFHAS